MVLKPGIFYILAPGDEFIHYQEHKRHNKWMQFTKTTLMSNLAADPELVYLVTWESQQLIILLKPLLHIQPNADGP